MNEYCITFIDDSQEQPAEVFHCHVHAPNDQLALEVAFHNAVNDNIQLSKATAVGVQLLLPLPADMMRALELLRVATNGALPTHNPTAPASHLH